MNTYYHKKKEGEKERGSRYGTKKNSVKGREGQVGAGSRQTLYEQVRNVRLGYTHERKRKK